MSDEVLERDLRRLGDDLPWPATPDLEARVLARLDRAPRRRPRTRRLALALTAALLVPAAVIVVGLATAEPREPDRVRSITSRLRCPVCQAESVADSPSETAREMTAIVAEQVREGRSDEEVLGFFRQRYGDWVLLDPPVSERTWPLWALPLAALAVGLLALLRLAPRPSRRLADDVGPDGRAVVAAERRRFEQGSAGAGDPI